MKKSTIVSLVLITAALSSCHKKQEVNKRNVYMRSDSTAVYSHSHHSTSHWFYAFRPYGMYDNGVYHRQGFYSSGISSHSNVGTNSSKSSTIRGGFGGRGVSVSS